VETFSENCTNYRIYKLNEKRLSPQEYDQEWLGITNDPTTNIGANLKVNFLISHAPEYAVKGTYGLIDRVKGYKNYNIN
jgi:hypothetical protein